MNNNSKKMGAMSSTSKVLIALAIIGIVFFGCYFFIHKPMQKNIATLNTEISAIDDDILEEEQKVSKLESKKEQIEIGKTIDGYVEKFDNATEELAYFNEVVKTANTYNISFGTPFTSDNIYVRRDITISFDADNYDAARTLLRDIINAPFRTTIKNIGISVGGKPKDSTQIGGLSDPTLPVSVSTSLTMFEQCVDDPYANGLTNNAPKPKDDAKEEELDE